MFTTLTRNEFCTRERNAQQRRRQMACGRYASLEKRMRKGAARREHRFIIVGVNFPLLSPSLFVLNQTLGRLSRVRRRRLNRQSVGHSAQEQQQPIKTVQQFKANARQEN